MGSTSETLAWLSSHAEELGPYAGMWIAVNGGKIIASGPNEAVVEEAARKQCGHLVLLAYIPPEDYPPFAG